MRKRRLQPTHTDDVATSGRELGLCYEVGGQVGQGRQDEPALPHAGMGDGEVGVVYDLALDEEDVGVEGAGAPPLGCFGPVAVGGGLEGPAALEQQAGRVGRAQLHDEVEVILLARRAADGLGLVEGRDGDDVAGRPELVDGGLEEGAAVAEVGAESDEGTPCGWRRTQRLRRTRTPVEATSRGSGGRSLRTVTSTASRRGS